MSYGGLKCLGGEWAYGSESRERASERAADTTIMEGRGKKKKSGKAVEKGETGGILKRCELRREAARRKWNEITDRKKG